MKLVVGLGNPGPRYERTRHNVGFMMVDQLHRQHQFAEFRDKFSGVCSKGSIGSTDVALLKPMTFMNESGRSVQAALAFYHINATAEETLVLHDELDLAFGEIRLKAAGGHAGHNGLRSIISSCGADFSRLRFGIGRPPTDFRGEVADYVLSEFDSTERSQCDALVQKASDVVIDWLDHGQLAMNRANTRPRRNTGPAIS
jgi:PTH1 family peptidyl-tRNA hydrolase